MSETQKFAWKLTPEEQAEKERVIAEGKLPEKLNRSLDLYFRFLLGHPERTELLIDVLNSVFVPLGHPKVKSVRLRATELAPGQSKLRHARLDVLVYDETGRSLNLEIQTWNDTFFPERLVLYNGRLLDFQTRRGKKLDVLRQTCSIALLAYNMFKSAADKSCAVWDFMFRDPTGRKTLTDKLWVILVEMPKLRTRIKKIRTAMKGNPAYKLTWEDHQVIWSAYFTNMKEGVRLVEALTQDRVFSQVPALEKEYWSDIDNRYRQYRAELEENSIAARERKIRRDSFAKGRVEGHAEGRVEGRAEGRAEGRVEGRNKMSRLIQILLGQGKTDELQRASADTDFCDSLFALYNL